MARFRSILLLAATFSACSAKLDNQENEAAFLNFPKDFLIGASSSAFQTEGAWNVDGKGISVWDHFVHTNSSRIKNNDNADIACDSYNKYKEDASILKNLGFTTYRISVSWTRILPNGFASDVNRAAIEHYKSVLDELLSNGIEPIVTMIHWDQPQNIEDLGGWTNELMVDWFGDYARILFRELGPKVKKWITMNEPEAHCRIGYGSGQHAPGKTVRGTAEYLCAHNALKAHARAYRIYQDEFKSTQNGLIGLTLNMIQYYPKNPETDRSAAETAFNFSNSWMLHPIFSKTGDYHNLLKKVVDRKSRAQGYPRSRLPEFSQEWIEYIRGSADFLGLNHYTSLLVERGETDVASSFLRDRGLVTSADPSWKQAASSWLNIVPKGFGDLLRKIAAEYGNLTIYVTENGVSDNGGTDDMSRVQYYHDYVKEMLVAVNRDGVNVKGYMVWSILDNFEWDQGYSESFGIVKVDFNDPGRKRELKQSACWWQRVTASRSLQPVERETELDNLDDLNALDALDELHEIHELEARNERYDLEDLRELTKSHDFDERKAITTDRYDLYGY